MKQLALLLPNGTTTLSSLILTIEVIEKANEYYKETGKQPVFKTILIGDSKVKLSKYGSFSIHQDNDLTEGVKADLIIVPSLGDDIEKALKQNEKSIEWVKNQYKAGAEVASLCTGAFVLAAAGLLDGKQCSTHWGAADAFKKLYPSVKLSIDKIITEEHGVYTTGGALSSMNLILYIIEKYYNRETAIYCAKVFEVDMDRNSQSSFIIFSGQKGHDDKEIKKAQKYMEEHVGHKIVMEEIAEKLSIDRRNFDRRFKKATGNTPLEYLQRVKIEVAKKYFETTRKNINEVMYDVGYTDVRAFREVFKKITGLSPIEYRGKYNKEASR